MKNKIVKLKFTKAKSIKSYGPAFDAFYMCLCITYYFLKDL